MNMTTSNKRKRIGFVSLWQDEGGRWRSRFKHPETGQDVRRTLPVTTETEARELAMEMNRMALSARGMIPSAKPRRGCDLAIADALIESIRASGGNDHTLGRYVADANAFQAFLSGAYPELTVWSDLRPSMIVGYLKAMRCVGLAHDTMKNRLKPIRRASLYWAAEHPGRYRDWVGAAGAGLRLERPAAKPIAILEPETMSGLLGWLNERRPRLAPIAHLMGLAGLRTWEAAYLRVGDVDLSAGTVMIDETRWHKPKNRGSYRTIPVMDEIMASIEIYLRSSSVRTVAKEDSLFLHSRAAPWRTSGLRNAWQQALLDARDDGLILPEGFIARRMRASFATMARKAKADARVLKRYLGHAPGDVLGDHYEVIDVSDMRSEVVDTVAGIWRGLEARQWHNPGNGIEEV